MQNPFRILLAALRLILIIVSLAIFVLPLFLADKIFGLSTKSAFKVRRMWIRVAKVILGITTQVEGQQYEETALYVCNHRSFADPLIISLYLNAYVIAKAEVGKLPILSTGAELTGVMYVQRESKDSRSAVKKKMVETLLEGKNVLVYPEGTTNGELHLKPYKRGTFIEAADNGIPVVPVVIEYKNAKDLWSSRGMVRHHFKQFGKLRTQCRLRFGPFLTSTDGEQLRSESEDWSNQSVKEIHQGWNSLFSSHSDTVGPTQA